MNQESAAGRPGTTEARAANVALADFSEQLTAGVLRAIAAQKRVGTGGDIPWHPHVWCGIWIRPPDPVFDHALSTDAKAQG